MISRDVRNTQSASNIPIALDNSYSEKRGMINKVIQLKLHYF